MNWTDERVEKLKKLWAEGLSASQIAAQLGGVSRNAVIGKVHRLKLTGRGLVRENMVADLVLFNPRTVIDRSTFAEPEKLSEGIEKVYVSGALVWDHDRATGARPGRVLPK